MNKQVSTRLWLLLEALFVLVLRVLCEPIFTAVAVSSPAQVFLSIALTLSWGPIPSIGVPGPAAAIVTCQRLAALYLGAYLMRGKAGVKLYAQALRWQPIANIMRVGGLGLINSASIALTIVTVTGFVGRYGTEALAGYGLGSRLELMLIPIAFSVFAVLTAAVGANFGASQFARARRQRSPAQPSPRSQQV
jgi:Na+-driven multidrug efflux pump